MNDALYNLKVLPHIRELLDLADKKRFDQILVFLTESGVPEVELGEMLFTLADRATQNDRPESGLAILQYLLSALKDPAESHLIFKKMGDLYVEAGRYDSARSCYGQLPLSIENIRLCLETCIPPMDMPNLISVRDQVLSKIPESYHREVSQIADRAVERLLENPELQMRHRQQYESNLRILEQIWPYSAGPSADWPGPGIPLYQKQVETETFRSGDLIYLKTKGQWRQYPIPLPFPKPEETALKPDQRLIVFCSSLESLLSLIHQATRDTPVFYKMECWVVVPFDVVRRAMHVADFSVLLHSSHLFRLIDHARVDAVLNHLLWDRGLMLPEQFTCFSKDEEPYLQEVLLPILKDFHERAARRHRKYELISEEIFDRDYQERVAEKIRNKAPLRIFCWVSKFSTYIQYSMRDLAAGFQQLGHEVFLETEDEDAGISIRQDITLKHLTDFRPDLVVVINQFRPQFPWFPKVIPFITWVQDITPYMRDQSNADRLTEMDHVFSFSLKWIKKFFISVPLFKGKEIRLLPVTVNPAIYHPIPSGKKIYDITYVGHLPDPERTLWGGITKGSPSYVASKEGRVFLESLIQILDRKSWLEVNQLTRSESNRNEIARKICSENNLPFNRSIEEAIQNTDKKNHRNFFLSHLLMLLKTKPIQVLVENGFDVKVFGKNWDMYSGFESIAMGVAENGSQLNQIINRSRINLNLSPGTSYHMKAPEVISAGGFLLTRDIPESEDNLPITSLFEREKEVALFKDESDLVKKTGHYLSHPEERKKIARRAYTKFIKSYDAKHTASQILNCLIGK